MNKYVSGIKYDRFLNMLRYSYSDIVIIVSNIIILEFLLARFVHLGTPQLTTLSFRNRR